MGGMRRTCAAQGVKDRASAWLALLANCHCKSRPSFNVFAHVLPDHGEPQRATVPFEPVQGNVVGNRAVTDQVRTTTAKKIDGGHQGRAKLVAPR